MRRIATIVFACLAVALMGAAMAVASPGKGSGNRSNDSATNTTGTTTTPNPSTRRPRKLEGRVVAIDATAKTFDLRVRRHHHRRAIVRIQVTDATLYRNLPNGFASIALRDGLKVKARKINGVITASKVAKKNRPNGASNDDRSGRGADGRNYDANDDRGADDSRGGNSGRN